MENSNVGMELLSDLKEFLHGSYFVLNVQMSHVKIQTIL